jgi:hypothetical protein
MKKFLVRCLINENSEKGALLGYVGRDGASGGYPYSSHDVEMLTEDYASSYMSWVAEKTEMSTYTNGGKNFPYDAAIFNNKYHELRGVAHRFDNKKALRFEMIEVDMTDVLFIESKILRVIEVEGLECNDYQGADKAYYRVTKDEKFN